MGSMGNYRLVNSWKFIRDYEVANVSDFDKTMERKGRNRIDIIGSNLFTILTHISEQNYA